MLTTRETEKRLYVLRDVETRDSAEGFGFDGYAAVFNELSEDLGGFREQVAPAAFNKTLSDGADVRLLVNHDGIPLARTKSATLSLTPDSTGLRVAATLDAANPTVQEIASAMRRGDLDQMSFQFQTIRDSWDTAAAGGTIRTLLEVRLADVSIVTFPAYPQTTGALRDQTREAQDGSRFLRACYAFATPDEFAAIAGELREGKVLSAKNQKLVSDAIKALEDLLAAAAPSDPEVDALRGETTHGPGEEIEVFRARLHLHERALLASATPE